MDRGAGYGRGRGSFHVCNDFAWFIRFFISFLDIRFRSGVAQIRCTSRSRIRESRRQRVNVVAIRLFGLPDAIG